MDCWCENTALVITFAVVVLYILYYRKFRNYVYHQVDDIINTNRPRGRCPPFFPNGWYRLLNSDELGINQVRFFNYCGRSVVLFRGVSNKVYALDAYCAHMGANLGHGGVVKNNCIQCPFHGWVFDGETGNCIVSADNKTSKTVQQYQYHDGVKEATLNKDGAYLEKCYEGNVKLKKYHVDEQHNSIMIWFDSRDEYQDKITYNPLPLNTKLDFRGESINYVNCHIQEIPENGADIRHFDFLHTRLISWVSFITFEWTMLSHRANEPNIEQLMKHKYDYINEFKVKKLREFITEENKDYINVISLCCFVKIFNFKIFAFNATGFQVGPALVYLFLKGPCFETAFAQSITPMDKFKIRVSHKIWTSSFLPYGLSAYMLYSEVNQVLNDMLIWNKKVFGSKLHYNMKTNADKNLNSWRNWYYQFYEGCFEFEKKLDALDW